MASVDAGGKIAFFRHVVTIVGALCGTLSMSK